MRRNHHPPLIVLHEEERKQRGCGLDGAAECVSRIETRIRLVEEQSKFGNMRNLSGNWRQKRKNY